MEKNKMSAPKKLIHIPTLIFHAVLILLAALLLKNYGGAFLWIGAACLVAYMVYAVRCLHTGVSPAALLASYLLGCMVQGMTFRFCFSTIDGLGASFAMLFYCLALLASAIILSAVIFASRALK